MSEHEPAPADRRTVPGGGQPPVSPEEVERASAALVPATSAGMPSTAQTFFAVVNPDGSLARGLGVVSSNRLGPGAYQVVFKHDLTRSALVATLGIAGDVGAPAPGGIAVAGRNGMPSGVFVSTWGSGGTAADRGFHLAVYS